MLWWATRAAWMASWTPGQAADRAAWAAEGLAAAREAGDRAAAAVLLVTLAVTELELGRRDDFTAHLAEGQRVAEEERLPYVLLTVYWLRMSLATIRGDDAGAERGYQGIADTAPDVAVPMQELQAAAAATMMGLWDPPRLREIVDLMVEAHEEFQDAATTVHQMLARCGRTDDLPGVAGALPDPARGRRVLVDGDGLVLRGRGRQPGGGPRHRRARGRGAGAVLRTDGRSRARC